jgi:hypothetical protein
MYLNLHHTLQKIDLRGMYLNLHHTLQKIDLRGMYLNLHHTLQKIDPRGMYCYVFLSISDTIYVLDKYDSYMF